jgi:hypothetical protein
MNTLLNILLVLTVFNWINLTAPTANIQPRTSDTASKREQQSTGNKGQEQTQTAEAETHLALALTNSSAGRFFDRFVKKSLIGS